MKKFYDLTSGFDIFNKNMGLDPEKITELVEIKGLPAPETRWLGGVTYFADWTFEFAMQHLLRDMLQLGYGCCVYPVGITARNTSSDDVHEEFIRIVSIDYGSNSTGVKPTQGWLDEMRVFSPIGHSLWMPYNHK